jgi:hypothetical protein
MKAMIAIFATLLVAGAAHAQRYSSGPFTPPEAEVMSAVWPKIREAARFEDIDWRAVGLSRAPGDRAAQNLMAQRWDSLREAAAFDDIDWASIAGYGAAGGYRQHPRGYSGDRDRNGERNRFGPFTSDEAAVMRSVWPEIREAADFRDIDWRAEGLRRAPGDSTARRIMETHWDQLREAADFYDIDWRATAGNRGH